MTPRSFLIISVVIPALLFGSLCIAQDRDAILKKTSSLIADLVVAKSPADFAKSHGIELKDGMMRVMLEIAKDSPPNFLSAKYNLRDPKINKNIMTAYIDVSKLKQLCEEPSVVFIRLPVKFRKI